MDMREMVSRLWGSPCSKSDEIAWYNCPRHEDTNPSCAVYHDHLHCFSCGWHSYPVSFLTQEQGYSKVAALTILGDRYTWVRKILRFETPLPPSLQWQEELAPHLCRAAHVLDGQYRAQNITKSKRALVWLDRRGITLDVMQEYKLGWQQDWVKLSFGSWLAEGLVIPVYKDGALWSATVRTVSGRPRYLRVKNGAKSVLFGLDQLQGHDTLILTEAELDALTVRSIVPGVDVLAIRGVMNRLKGWEVYFMSYKRVIICFDGDDAGQVAASILLEDNPRWENREPPEGKDIGDLVVEWPVSELRDWLLTGLSL